MVRLSWFPLCLLAAEAWSRPVHPEGQYYVEEEEKLRRARAARKAVPTRLGTPLNMKAGQEVELSDDGFGLTVEKAGDGVNFPKAGDKLTMHYIGRLKDGTVFDSSRDREEPFTFTIGKHQVITGWDQGIITMSLGERAVMHVPSYKGYGSRGAGPIPPNADLDFDVELLAINDLQAPGLNPTIKAIKEPAVDAPKANAKSGANRRSAVLVVAAAAVAAQALLWSRVRIGSA